MKNKTFPVGKNPRVLFLRLLAVACLSFLSFALAAQSPKEDFKRVNEEYKNLVNFSQDFTYKLYINNSPDPAESLTGKIKQSGANRYQKIGDVEIITNQKYHLITDHEDKIIMIGEVQSSSPMDFLNKLSVDSALKIYKEVVPVPTAKNQKAYRMTFLDEESAYKAVAIYFNATSFLVEKIIFYYHDGLDDEGQFEKDKRIEMSFFNINKNPQFQANDFSESRFLKKVNGQFSLLPTYQSYSFINQLN